MAGWDACEKDECHGIKLANAKVCLAHADHTELNRALARFRETGEIDARGVQITSPLLEQILAAAPREGQRPHFNRALFHQASFEDGTSHHFAQVIFEHDATFDDATFHGRAWFSGRLLESGAAIIEPGTTFRGDASFANATFEGDATFARATFCDDANFFGAKFRRDAIFNGATFHGYGVFGSAEFNGNARFDKVTFIGDRKPHKNEIGYEGFATFEDATFERAPQLGPLLAYRKLILNGVRFALPVEIEAGTTRLDCARARFLAGVQFRVCAADIRLVDTDLSASSLRTSGSRLTGISLSALRVEKGQLDGFREHIGATSEQPRLMSLRGADVAGLSVGNINLADCRFAGARNLDQLRLDFDVTFAFSPSRLGWERRQVIAEERTWRATRSGRWSPSLWPDWLGKPPGVVDPGLIAGLYRALRKSREDAKNEPGAADFYYGEMEMRRHSRFDANSEAVRSSRGRADRGVLTAYWLVSGYGLRAWRALAWLAAATAVFAIAFHLLGFTDAPQPVSYWTSLLYAFRATISLTDNDVTLTTWGKSLQALLRLTGPVLLGLALLALRNRVRR